MDVNPKKMGLCSLSHSDESLLRKILGRGPLTNTSIKECVGLFSLIQPNEYEIWLRKRIELTLRVVKENLLHDDYKPLIKDSKKQLNELLKKAAFNGNTGQIPTYLWRVLQILNFATPKEAQLQSDEDKEIGNLTIPDAACLMVYPRIFGKHLCNKAGIDMPKITSLGQIDLHITSVECDCSATGDQRTNDLKEHRQAVCDALNINEDQYFLPPQLDMIDAGQLHNNANGTPIEAFATTQVADDKLAMGVKRGVFRKTGDEDKIVAFVTSLPHPEMALRGRFANTSDELLKKYDKCITAVLRRLPELSDLPADVESDLFIKMKKGNMSEEEIAEREKLLKEIRQHALYMRWLPVVRPGCTSEDIQHAKKEFLKYDDFTEEEQAIIRSELREMGRKGGLVNALKFVGRENPNQLVASGVGWNDFTDDEWKLLRQMFKKMGEKGSLTRALKFVGRDNPDQLVASGFDMNDFSDDEWKQLRQMYSEMSILRALKFVGRDNPAELVANGVGWNDFTDDEWKLLRQMFKKMGEKGALTRALKFVGRDNPDQLVANGVGWNDFSEDDWKLLRQMFREMGEKGGLVRALKFVGRENPNQLVASGFDMNDFSDDEWKQLRQMYSEMSIVRALKIAGRDNPAELVASGFTMDNFTIEERNTISKKCTEWSQLSHHGPSDEEIVKKIEENNSVDEITKTILSNNLGDIAELLPTGVTCNAKRYMDVSLLLQKKYRVWNITKAINQCDNEILLAMLDVFTENELKQASSKRKMKSLINSSDRIRVTESIVRRITNEGLFQGDLALKYANAKKAVEAKPVEKKRKASQETYNKKRKAERGFNPEFNSLTAVSKPLVQKRKTESTSNAVKSSSDKHDSKPLVQKRKTESTSNAVKSSSDKHDSKPKAKKRKTESTSC
eukprot:scaffold85431_cov50-Cyclotella_meneghiniana.AAC.1